MKVKYVLLCIILNIVAYGVHMDSNSKIYVAGHNGLVGKALMHRLNQAGYHNIIVRSHTQLDLRNQQAVNDFFAQEQPEYVFLLAAKVGGIKANNMYPAQFIYDNLMIEANVIDAAHKHNVTKLLFLGSSCIYPRDCPQPIKEEYLLSGPLEPTNKPYAVAKIAGIELCQAYNRQYKTNFICCMPTNLYGPNDHFNTENSHVIPALVTKFYNAKQSNAPFVQLWGTGKPRREFLFVEDLADALVFVMNHYNDIEIVNVGTGVDVTIAQLAQTIKTAVGYTGKIVFNNNALDGTPRKWLAVDKLARFGWRAHTPLYFGIAQTVEWFKANCILK